MPKFGEEATNLRQQENGRFRTALILGAISLCLIGGDQIFSKSISFASVLGMVLFSVSVGAFTLSYVARTHRINNANLYKLTKFE